VGSHEWGDEPSGSDATQFSYNFKELFSSYRISGYVPLKLCYELNILTPFPWSGVQIPAVL
jgi:hypothetical protein